MTSTVPTELIVNKIVFLRGEKVLLDRDLAELYGVETGALNRAVKRNAERFPEDFMFQVTGEEAEVLRCQTGISKPGRGGRRYLPYVFTEQGVAMLSSVLNRRLSENTKSDFFTTIYSAARHCRPQYNVVGI
ncbi:MAG: ORF6N domain-containing protein [Thermodesulfobacteriota bacterium]|nr:ORF6N domain-containing protein [Thermodesulfobacteriota bacterium]